MLKLGAWLLRLQTQLGRWLARRLHTAFYLYLAAAISICAIVDATHLHWVFDLRQTSFDQMVKHRLHVAAPDPDIVILNIDEASLALLANDLGRWPWPRQVLADVLSRVAQQQPRAIVFDILFSEPDIYNPDSDAAFNSFLQDCRRCYLPWVRLDPAQDAGSALAASQLPGALPRPGRDRTIAGILPFFPAAQDGGRLGFNTARPDRDGIIRQYAVYEDHGAARLPSLPARVLQGRELATGLNGLPPSMLLNWRGEPFSYRYVSFADLYRDILSEHPKRPADEFRNRIVIIGSTAASLFDVKATPVADQFPGVEIVATAIDNLKHDDYLRLPPLRWLYLLIALLLVWATAWSFYRHAAPEKLARWFGLSQIALLAISWASINVSHYYINLLGPVSFAIAYFTLAKLYALATRRVLEHNALSASSDAVPGSLASLAWLQLRDRDGEPMPDALLHYVHASLPPELAGHCQPLTALQAGGWRLLEGSLLICLLLPPGADNPLEENQLRQHIEAWLQQQGLHAWQLQHCSLCSAPICAAASGNVWQRLLAQALLDGNSSPSSPLPS